MAWLVLVEKAWGKASEPDYPNLAPKANWASILMPAPFAPASANDYSSGEHFSLSHSRTNCMQIKRTAILGALTLVMLASAVAQQATKHVLSSDEVKKAVPTEYFFRGQKAPVQVRNAVGFQLADGKMMLAALVDASGYSTAIQQKYQGMLITETKLNIGGSELNPGEYGFGFSADGKFVVMDVANNDVLSASSQTEQALQHAVPLKLVEDGAAYKLYAGKKWVGIKTE